MFNIEFQNGCEAAAAHFKQIIHEMLAQRGWQFAAVQRPPHLWHDEWIAETQSFIKPAVYVEQLYISHVYEQHLGIQTFERVTIGKDLLACPCLTVVLHNNWDGVDEHFYVDLMIKVGEIDIRSFAHLAFNLHNCIMSRAAYARCFTNLPSVKEAKTIWLPQSN